MELAFCLLDISYESERNYPPIWYLGSSNLSYPSVFYITIAEVIVGSWQGSLLYLELQDGSVVVDILYCRKMFHIAKKSFRALRESLGL
jgi:hypothetical protein